MNTKHLAVSHRGVLTLAAERAHAATAQPDAQQPAGDPIMTAVQTIVTPEVAK
jgi:hypothetical protein